MKSHLINPEKSCFLNLRNFTFFEKSSGKQNRSKGYPPMSEVSEEVANLTERKNKHTPVYGVKEFVFLSVINFDPNYFRTGIVGYSGAKRYNSSHANRSTHYMFLH